MVHLDANSRQVKIFSWQKKFAKKSPVPGGKQGFMRLFSRGSAAAYCDRVACTVINSV
jgi:hypothetical protein